MGSVTDSPTGGNSFQGQCVDSLYYSQSPIRTVSQFNGEDSVRIYGLAAQSPEECSTLVHIELLL